MTPTELLLSRLAERGLRARTVSAERLEDLAERIAGPRRQGQFDDEFFRERLTHFDFRRPEHLPGARSIIILTVPQTQVRLLFRWRGRAVAATLPPTYLQERKTDANVRATVEELLKPLGFSVAPCRLPLKTLVVQSGLGRYGRNNITYVEGLGSFHRPVAFFTDFAAEDQWQDPTMMPSCEHCAACRKACPTQAIPDDRFLLRAERCLVFLNEKPAGVPLPDWVPASSYDCIVGCMACQRACPQNRHLISEFDPGPEFDEDETALLVSGTGLDRLPRTTAAKIEALGLDEYLGVIPRNLAAIINAAR